MLDFDNRPPTLPEDIHISPSGASRIASAREQGRIDELKEHGKTVAREIINSLEGERPDFSVRLLGHQVLHQASDVLDLSGFTVFAAGCDEVFREHEEGSHLQEELVG